MDAAPFRGSDVTARLYRATRLMLAGLARVVAKRISRKHRPRLIPSDIPARRALGEKPASASFLSGVRIRDPENLCLKGHGPQAAHRFPGRVRSPPTTPGPQAETGRDAENEPERRDPGASADARFILQGFAEPGGGRRPQTAEGPGRRSGRQGGAHRAAPFGRRMADFAAGWRPGVTGRWRRGQIAGHGTAAGRKP